MVSNYVKKYGAKCLSSVSTVRSETPSFLSQQAHAIPPLRERCAPSHRNTDVITSGASSINLNDKALVFAVCERRKIQNSKVVFLQLCEPVRKILNQIEIVDCIFSKHQILTWFTLIHMNGLIAHYEAPKHVDCSHKREQSVTN